MPELVKCSIRLNKADLEVIQQHYQDIGYNKILRHLCSKLAQGIRQNRTHALREVENSLETDE